ncbi:hypothetical protein MAIC_12020 [Mycolicibacterium aichiense]|uniref:Uncharacterized protein n=2 Tax=Mycolicibacterium aichiense TaxID=1799 RepID=A0AAD1HKK4_9MYCO|nr:hypothetical protein MAIC_12020 [Mycolicibacterium aichiense]STZ24264.1 Uncharacterised protein [Mycolicibacterium aichiense]
MQVGIAEDLDVPAGKTTPFDRPHLGKWLTTRRGEFDVIVFSVRIASCAACSIWPHTGSRVALAESLAIAVRQRRQPRDRAGTKTIPLDYADAEVERQTLKNMGPLERRRRVWFAGNDHTDELSEVNSVLEDLTDQLGVGVFKQGTPQRTKLDQRIAALSARQAELSSVPSQPAGWRFEPTGELFSDWWNDQDDEAENIWLRQSGFRYEWSSHSHEQGRVVVDWFERVGELEMDLDGDRAFGPLADFMAALSDPANFEDAPPS